MRPPIPTTSRLCASKNEARLKNLLVGNILYFEGVLHIQCQIKNFHLVLKIFPSGTTNWFYAPNWRITRPCADA